ncbi:hypothetical protein [Pseudoscardovia suis]|uniref:hypothetical protein n=1 Tax=Pseudoscardovia suis TaxID=987063 RepID=UPI003F9B8316
MSVEKPSKPSEAKRVRLIAGLYCRFLTRKVLRAGILKQKSARLGIAVLLELFMVMVGIVSYSMLGNVSAPLMDVVLDSYGISGVLIASLIFAIVTLIFSKSSQLQALTMQLPVTNRHRASAMAVFEMGMLLVGMAIFFGPYLVALCLRTGSQWFGRSMLACVFPGLCVFFLFAVVYAAADRLLMFLPSRWRSVVLELLLAAGFFGVYRWQVWSIEALGKNYVDGGHEFIASRSFVMLADRTNGAVAGFAWLALIAACCVVYVLIVPDAAIRDFRYVKVPCVRLGMQRGRCAGQRGRWALAKAYVIRSVRAYETIQALVMAVALYVVLAVNRNMSPVYAADVMLVASLFAYVDTEPLRNLEIWGRAVSLCTSVRHYLLILLGQFIPSCCVFLAMCVSEAVLTRNVAWGTDAIVLGVLAASTLLFVLAGVLFPPHRDNPFSVGISLTVVMTLLIVVAVSVVTLRLPLWAKTVLGACAVGVCLYFSIYGIYVNERNKRNEVRH